MLSSEPLDGDGEDFRVSLSGLPAGPEPDLELLLPSSGAVTDGWLSAFGTELAAAVQNPKRLEALLSVVRSADRRAALGDDVASRRALTACGQITGALFDRARVSRPPFAASSEPGRMLLAIAEVQGRTNEQISNATGLSITQVSRTGARLAREGWAVPSRLGRANAWTVTPNGARVVEILSSAGPTEEFDNRSQIDRPSLGQFLPEVAVLRAVATAGTRLSVDQLVSATSLSRREAATAVARLTRAQYLIPHEPSSDQAQDDGWVQLAVGDSPQRAIGVTVQPGVLLGVITTMTAEWAGPPHRVQVDTANPEAVVEAITRLVGQMLRDSQVERDRIVGLGVNLPGHVDGDSGTVIFSHSFGGSAAWTGFPLAQRIRDHSGFEVVLENDVNALAVHAQAFGDARGLSNIAVVYIAPNGGVGAGLIADRRLVRGHSWAAGELGHIPVPGSDYLCRCGHLGCVEASMYVSTLSSRMKADGGEEVDSWAAGAALAQTEEESGEDGPATRAFRSAGRDLGIGLAAVVNLVNPQKLLLSGPLELINVDAYGSARAFDAGLRETFHAHGFGSLGDTSIVTRAYQSPYDAAVGAAATLLRRTVYATPSEVPETATQAVPWLRQHSEDAVRRDLRLATMAAI